MSFTDAAQLIVDFAPCLSEETGFSLLRALIDGRRLFCSTCQWFYNPQEPCLCSMTSK